MDAIGIYVAFNEKTKSQLETEMYYLLEQNIELEREIRAGEKAKKKLEENREILTELAKTYLKVKGDL